MEQVRSKTVAANVYPLWNQILTMELEAKTCSLNIEVVHTPDVQDGKEPLPEVVMGSFEMIVQEDKVDGYTNDWFSLKSTDDSQTRPGRVRIATSFEREPIEALRKGLVPSSKKFRRLVSSPSFCFLGSRILSMEAGKTLTNLACLAGTRNLAFSRKGYR